MKKLKKEFIVKKLIFTIFVAVLFLVGCSNNSKKSEGKTVQESVKQEKIAKVEPKPVAKPKTEEKTLEQNSKEVSNKVVKAAQENVKKIVKKSKELLKTTGNNEVVKSVIKKSDKLVEKVKKSKIVQKVSKATNGGVAAVAGMLPASLSSSGGKTLKKENSVDAKKLFGKCAGCHGNKAQNKALGVSHVIAGWDAKKIEHALKGYKAGTYGGAMKGVMKTQASSLNDADIKALAEYISKL